jgi:DNA-binding CsgD family transcriptional regulator
MSLMTNAKQSPLPALPQPLSQRETEILVLLAEGLSNREIAERRVVAYTTVKWYIRQIFNKLGVDNRQEAIERAKALGLVRGSEAATPAIATTTVTSTPNNTNTILRTNMIFPPHCAANTKTSLSIKRRLLMSRGSLFNILLLWIRFHPPVGREMGGK